MRRDPDRMDQPLWIRRRVGCVSGRRIGEAAWWTRQHHGGSRYRRLAREDRESARRRTVGRARPRRLFVESLSWPERPMICSISPSDAEASGSPCDEFGGRIDGRMVMPPWFRPGRYVSTSRTSAKPVYVLAHEFSGFIPSISSTTRVMARSLSLKHSSPCAATTTLCWPTRRRAIRGRHAGVRRG